MPPKKKVKVDEEAENEGPKYVAGKMPRQGDIPPVEYSESLRPDSELFKEEWSIPKFNAFVTYTLDDLRETYPNIFKDFIKLPSRKFHPQYYYKIDQPISINEIKNRDYEYADGTKDFLLDVELLAKNCAAYNEEDSLIVKNAYQMVNYIKNAALKAKNVKRNYMLTADIKPRVEELLKGLIDATALTISSSIPSLTAKLQDTSDNEFKLSEPFMEMVDKEGLPEYYEVINKPIALGIVQKNLEMNYYTKVYDFITDVHTVFDNAFVFNSADSLIYQSALALLEYFDFTTEETFFKGLKDLSERGEVTLEFDKYEMDKYLGHGGNSEQPLAADESDEELDDFNHVEGLGNGYTRNLLTEDYLLGPNYTNTTLSKTGDGSTVALPEKTNKQVNVPKFNIIKSLKTEAVSDQFKMEKKIYDNIEEVSIFTSKGLYTQGINPMQGSGPSCAQNWLQFDFIGNQLNQNENIFSLSLDPIQTFLTVVTRVTKPNLKVILQLNKDIMRPRKDKKRQHNAVDGASTGEEGAQEDATDLEPVQEKFDIRLTEGLNMLEVRCETTMGDSTATETTVPPIVESMKFWINVAP